MDIKTQNLSQSKASTYTTIEPNKIMGYFNVVRTVGGSEITKIYESSQPKQSIKVSKLIPQGNVEVSFTLSGDILNLIPNKGGKEDFGYNDLAENTDNLSTLIKKAYDEIIRDANSEFTLTSDEDFKYRKLLSDALKVVFGKDANKDLKFIFNSIDGDIKIITFDREAFFPNKTTSPDYIRYIIDLDAMSSGVGRNKSTSSSKIPIKMMIRVGDPSNKSLGALKTNTEYRFVGTENNKSFRITGRYAEVGLQPGISNVNVVGFTMSTFKTKKIPSLISRRADVAGTDKSIGQKINIIFNKGNDGENNKNKIPLDLYLNDIQDKTYMDMFILLNRSGINKSGENDEKVPEAPANKFIKPIERKGTSIKFRPILFDDRDKTITKIEFEDDRGNLYKTQLVPEDSSIENSLTYVEVIGLERGMPYIFRKMHINYNLGDKNERKTIYFAESDDEQIIKRVNTLPIMTTYFSGPKLRLIGKVECEDASHTGTSPSPITPSDRPIKPVKLPSDIDAIPVLNDRTALRYILEPDSKEGTLGDLIVNGLSGEENFKVDTTLDSNGDVSYYTLKLTGLMSDRDYGFLMLELEYKDPQGNSLVTRQSLYDINNQTICLQGDNKTEKSELPVNKVFTISIKDAVTSKNPRMVEVPVFIDDLYDNFVGMNLIAPKESPNAKASYKNGKIEFTDLTPDTTAVYRLDFDYKTGNNGGISTFVRSSNASTAQVSRYITITTPKIQDLDIKSVVVTPNLTSADFKFEYYSEPKSPIKTVVVKDSLKREMKSFFDKVTNTLTIEELTENTKYSGVEVSFILENGKVIKHDLESFTTTPTSNIIKPTGKVADFVAKVYKFALGREPEVEGWKFWINKLESKELSVTEFILGLMKQEEFVSKLISKEQFVKMMYGIVVGREPEEDGQKYWEQKYDEYRAQEKTTADTRIRIAREMMDTQEFKSYVESLGLKY